MSNWEFIISGFPRKCQWDSYGIVQHSLLLFQFPLSSKSKIATNGELR